MGDENFYLAPPDEFLDATYYFTQTAWGDNRKEDFQKALKFALQTHEYVKMLMDKQSFSLKMEFGSFLFQQEVFPKKLKAEKTLGILGRWEWREVRTLVEELYNIIP